MRIQSHPAVGRTGQWRSGTDRGAIAAARGPHSESREYREGVCAARVGCVHAGGAGPRGSARRSANARSGADGRRECANDDGARPAHRRRGELSAAQSRSAVHEADGRVVGDGEPNCRRAR